MPEEPRQYWVRNDKGKLWGPLTFATIELLLENKLIPGKLQASRDGLNFAYPGRFPDLRDAFPKELWGDSTEPLPDDELASVPAKGGPPVIGAPGSRPREVTPRPPPQAARPVAAAAARTPTPAPAKTPTPLPSSEAGLPASGDLATYSPFFLYYLIATGNEAGRLELKGPEATYEIFFKKGSPEAVVSSREEEDFGAFLVDKGVVKTEQLADARKLAPGFGNSILNALFGLQLIGPGDAFKHIGAHALGLMPKALSPQTGTFTFQRDVPFPSTAMPLGERWAIACAAVRAIPLARIEEQLGPRMQEPVMKSGGRVDIAKLKLNAQEARAASYFDGVHSLEGLCETLPAERETLIRTAFLLSSFEALSFAEGVVADKPKPKPAAEQPASEAAPAHERTPTPTPAPNAGAASARPAPHGGPRRITPPPPGGPPRIGPPAGSPPKLTPPHGAPPRSGPPAGAPPKLTPPDGSAPAGNPPMVGSPDASHAKPAAAASAPPKIGPPPGAPPKIGPPAGAPPKANAPARAAAPQARPAAPQAKTPATDSVEGLSAKLAELKGKNYFEVLDIARDANAAHVKTAFFKLAKTYHPDTVPADAPAEVGKAKADIFALINEAYRVLSDEKSRAEYVANLDAGSPEQVDAARILASEEAFQKGCILVKARKFQEAVDMLGEAINLYDKEGELYAWHGWARFLAARDKNAAKNEAFKELETAIKLNPKCAQSYYFVGQINKLSGDAATALKWFKKALAVDPNNMDAQREVRSAPAPKLK